MCKLIVFRVSDQGARFEVSFFSFQRVCACVVVFGEGVLTPTLTWLGDKRPDYSTWHPLDCLNIVQFKSDPELLSLIFLSSFPPRTPLSLSRSPLFSFLSLVRDERGICVPAQRRSLQTEVF